MKNFPERRIKAGHGGNSAARKLMGVRGKDVTVEVPCGVKAISDDKFVIGGCENFILCPSHENVTAQ